MATPKHLFAYLDTFSGLVPCVVLDMATFKFGDHGTEHPNVVCQVTASRAGYPKGDIIKMHPRHVWPRDVSRPKRGSYGQTYIVPAYDWRERLAR